MYIRLLILMLLPVAALGGDGKLLATAGLSQVEGSGGGGLVPWATLTGYDSQDQFSLNIAKTQVDVEDYRLDVVAISESLLDRIEFSVARQRLDLKTLGGEISQNVLGLKYRLYGDVVYSRFPQLSFGLQHKRLEDKAIAQALGATDTSGTDFYLAATKVHLGALGGYNAVWNVTARATKANQMGLLGFGGTKRNSYELMMEASAGILLSRSVAVGLEYRTKPDNLAASEDDWSDLFISFLPNKNISLTLAWSDLGEIAGMKNQRGLYMSLNAQLW